MNLSPEDAKLFFDLMWGLQRYVNQQRGILKDIPSSAEYAKLPTEKKLKVRDALWKSPDLIDAYLEANPEALSSEEVGIVRTWRRFIKDNFFIFRHLKKYSIFIGNKDQVYGVLGLFDSLEEIVPTYALPRMVDAVLLPFKGWIIYDGMLGGYSVSFGDGIRSNLNHVYMTAKQKERIITTLDPDTSQAKLAIRKISKTWLSQLEEIASSASKLKGDTALQNAAFTLLRTSIKIAKCAETNPQDLDVLFAGERKVQKALTRFSKVLDIEMED
jgi:hypothetical protein